MKPLQHVTILDLSRVLACPFASMILAELGANVIKIEEPNRGDETRSFEEFLKGDDVEKIKSTTENLMQASYKLAEVLYADQQAGQAAAAGGGGAEAGASADEDVSDADFEVVDEGDEEKK